MQSFNCVYYLFAKRIKLRDDDDDNSGDSDDGGTIGIEDKKTEQIVKVVIHSIFSLIFFILTLFSLKKVCMK